MAHVARDRPLSALPGSSAAIAARSGFELD
jgi:hypothetical protein